MHPERIKNNKIENIMCGVNPRNCKIPEVPMH